MKTYTMENKPTFKQGEQVSVDMAHLGCPIYGILPGKIVGRGMINVIDIWLVEFNRTFEPTYPYKVVGIPHTAILSGKNWR